MMPHKIKLALLALLCGCRDQPVTSMPPEMQMMMTEGRGTNRWGLVDVPFNDLSFSETELWTNHIKDNIVGSKQYYDGRREWTLRDGTVYTWGGARFDLIKKGQQP